MPGTLCTEACFAPQAERLRDVARTQIIPLREGATIADTAGWVLEQSPASFGLVGFSQGAIVALEIMRRAPEAVTGLCLMSANPAAAAQKQLELWKSWQEAVLAGRFDEIAEGFAKNLHPARLGAGELAQTVVGMARDTGAEVFIRQLKALASRSDSRGSLADIACPTLLLAGRQDRVTPLALHIELKTAIAGAKLVVVEDCGHYLPLEQPEAVSDALRDWLQGA